MKKIYLLLSTLIISTFAYCQVSVSASAGTPGPTGYSSLKLAFDAINLGTHQGVIFITVTGTSTEAATAVLNASGSGGAAYTGLSINPAGGAGSTITGNITGPLIDLNGADNVTIDGLNSGGNSLTISNINTGNTAGTSTIRFINDATSNTIQNTTILGAGTNTTSGTLLFSTGTTTGNDNNTFTNCTIGEASGFPVNAVYSLGNVVAGQENSGITFSNCNIQNFFNADLPTVGMAIVAGNTDWTLTGNKFYQTGARSFTTANPHKIIQIISGNNYNISNNIIGFNSSSGTGTYTLTSSVVTTLIVMDIAVGSTVASSIQNNTIANISLSTNSSAGFPIGVFCGINITTGDVNVGTVAGNTIGSTTAAGSILVTPAVTGAYLVPINSSSTGNISISNNKIGGIDLVPGGVFSGNINCIQASGATGNILISKNTIGNALANNIRVGTNGTTTSSGLIRGIFNTNSGSVAINLNNIRNLTHNSSGSGLFRAIECQQGTPVTISGNTISGISTNGIFASATTPVGIGILVSAPNTGVQVIQNTISNLSAINTTTTGNDVYGIDLGSTTNGISVLRNVIYGISNLSTSVSTTAPSVAAGIFTVNANVSNPMTIANNMISLGNGQPTNTSFIGIWNQASASPNYTEQVYYNSINIEGTATSGAQPTFCYYRGNFSTTAITVPTVDIRNNIFTNTRTGGTGKHYAISNGYGATGGSSAAGWGANASDYNNLYSTSFVGFWTSDQTFSGWKTASSSDGHSPTPVAVNYVNSASDLHLVTTSNAAVDGKATPIAAITTDFDNEVRNAATPDLGSDEFTPGFLAITLDYFKGNRQGNLNVLNWKYACGGGIVAFGVERSIDGRNFGSIGTVSAGLVSCGQPFVFTDVNPLPRVNYYRLRMTESDGQISYSMVVAILNKEKGFEIIGMMPVLVENGVSELNLSSAVRTGLEVVISDMQGKIVQRMSTVLESGSNAVKIHVAALNAGVYNLTGVVDGGEKQTVRFVVKE